MISGIFGKKIGMSQVFDETGNLVPVTLVKVETGTVTQIKTKEKDGYDAVQLGFGEAKKLNKPLKGHVAKAKVEPKIIREIKLDEPSNIKIGDKVDISIFNKGDIIEIVGISKGKGFAGVIKRHGFSRGPETHGSRHHRAPGSIGSMFPQHVFKGKKLPGRMGQKKITLKNKKIIDIDPENQILAISGSIPGASKSWVLIKKFLKIKKKNE